MSANMGNPNMGNLGHVVLLVLVWAAIVIVGCSILSYIRAELKWRRIPKNRRKGRLEW
jgi:hypothetical protein